MADIFESNVVTTQNWSVSGARLNYSTKDGTLPVDLVIMGITMQYQRRVNPIYPITSTSNGITKINILGSPVGTLDVQGILGPNKGSINSFLTTVGRPGCGSGVTFYIHPFADGCVSEASTTQTALNTLDFTLKGVVLETVTLQLQGGEAPVVNLPLRFSFTSLEM